MTREKPDLEGVRQLHAMLADACLSRGAPERFENDLAGYLASHDVDEADGEAIAGAPVRLALYRELVRNNLTGVIQSMLERTAAILERFAPGGFEAFVAAFLDEVGPRTPHLRDVPREFLAWARSRWATDRALPPWLCDYAELELVDFTIGVAPRVVAPADIAEVAGHLPLVFATPCTLVRLAWAVHERPAAPDAESVGPDHRAVTLFVYRDADNRCRYLELSSLAAAMMAELLDGEALAQAMANACAKEHRALDEAVVSGAATLLADLGGRGVLLGARAQDATARP